MTDYTDEIDAIFRRVERTVDLSNIDNKKQLYDAIEDVNQSHGRWNNRLNSEVFDELVKRRDGGEEYWLNRAISQAKSLVIATSKNAKVVFQAVFNKKKGDARIVARDAGTGRFTKVDPAQLKRSLHLR